MSAPISIIDGEYKINAGSWTNIDGIISNGDELTLRRTSSSVNSTLVDTTVTVGAYSTSFSITTKDSTAFSAQRTSDFQKNNCSGGQVGTIVTFTKNYTSNISQSDADNQASSDINFNTEGQVNANSIGNCNTPLPSDAVGILVIDLFENIDVCAFVDTTGIVPYQIPVYKGQNFLPNDGTPAANCWALASDLITGNGNLDYRFEFNIARLLNTYPSIPEFVFKVRGRGASTFVMSGSYSLKGADAGNMTMLGSMGSYIPSVVSASDLGITSFSNKPYGGGADGNIGLAYGTDILVFTYNVAAKTITLQ